MTRNEFDVLIKFCAEQHNSFNESSWISVPNVNRELLAVSAKFLSVSHWFGHEDELTKLAEKIDGNMISMDYFTKQAVLLGFEFGKFSSSLKVEVLKHA
jgi:hypothetical protein